MEIFWDYLACGMAFCLCLLVILYCFMRVYNSATRANYMSDFPLWLRNRLSCFLRFCCFEVSISSFDVFHGLLAPFLNDLIIIYFKVVYTIQGMAL